jgi:hypothetical protein
MKYFELEVEAAVVLELLVKKIPPISLKRLNPNPDSPLLKYVKDKNKSEISTPDLVIELCLQQNRTPKVP